MGKVSDRSKMLRRLVFTAVLAGLMAVMTAGPAFAATASGTCGTGLSWKLSGDTLTISGSGTMSNFGTKDPSWAKYQNKIKKVVIQEGVTSVGEDAFTWYDQILSVRIPDTMTTIGKEAFCGTKIKELYLPDSVSSVGENAFQFCEQLQTVRLSPSCPVIQEYAFGQCDALVQLDVPDGVVEIGKSAFSSCIRLRDVSLPDSLKKIDEEAFSKGSWGSDPEGLTDMGTLLFPEGLEYIGSKAFANAGLTEDTYLPVWVDYMARDAFFGTEVQQKIPEENEDGMVIAGTTLMNYRGTDEIVEIPDGITAISNQAFQNLDPNEEGGSWRDGFEWDDPEYNTTCRQVLVPDSVKYIGEEAFYRASALEYINLSHVENIENSAFWRASALKEVTLSENVRYLGNDVFFECKGLTQADLGGLADIPANTFRDCTSLTSLRCGGPIRSIGEAAFENCSKLKDFPQLAEGANLIPDYAFYNCRLMSSFTIPATVKEIGYAAFLNCKGLASITIPPAVRSIDYEAFKSSGLKTIRGVLGSAANTYASQHKIKFVEMGTKGQSLGAKATVKKVKYKKVKKKAQTVTPIKVTSAIGAVRYKITGGKTKAKKALKINAKTGAIKVAKKTKKGTYSVKVKVTACGNSEYRSASKTLTVKVKVK